MYRIHPLLPDEYVSSITPTAAPGPMRIRDIQGAAADDDDARGRLGRTRVFVRPSPIPGPSPCTTILGAREVRTRRRDRRFGGRGHRSHPAAGGYLDTTTSAPGCTSLASELERLSANPRRCTAARRLPHRGRIDTMVGLLAENPPAGFGFRDTAFRVFILMASRRLQSDRFLTVDFLPEIYTPLGWIGSNDNGMTTCSCVTAPSWPPSSQGGPVHLRRGDRSERQRRSRTTEPGARANNAVGLRVRVYETAPTKATLAVERAALRAGASRHRAEPRGPA